MNPTIPNDPRTEPNLNAPRRRRTLLTPQSLEAEQATIGACLMEGSALALASEIVSADDFYRELHKKIFRVCQFLAAKSQPVDIVTVAQELKAREQLEECGGPDYLSSTIEACPSSASVESYARTVLDCSQKRGFAILASELEMHAMNGNSAGDIRVWLSERLSEFSARAASGEGIKEWSAQELLETEFPPARFAVEGLLPMGLTIFAGAPKIGKSWLSYNLALAVAQGTLALGKHEAKQGDALYLALEDTPMRLKERLKVMLQGPEGTLRAPSNLTLACDWPRLDQGGLERLDAWIAAHPDCRLVVIDTFQKVRPARNGSNVYEEDYLHFAALKRIADARGVAIVVVLHTAKRDSADVLQTIAGSTGQTGAADAIWVLQRSRSSKDARLYITGRDVGEGERLLTWTPELGLYTEVSEEEASGKTMSSERHEVLEVLRESQWPMAPREVAELLDKKPGAVRKLLWGMKNDGQVRAFEGDKYALTDWAKNASVPPTSGAAPPGGNRGASGVPPYPDWLDEASAKAGEGAHVGRNFWVFWHERYTNAECDPNQFAEYFPLWMNGQWPQK